MKTSEILSLIAAFLLVIVTFFLYLATNELSSETKRLGNLEEDLLNVNENLVNISDAQKQISESQKDIMQQNLDLIKPNLKCWWKSVDFQDNSLTEITIINVGQLPEEMISVFMRQPAIFERGSGDKDIMNFTLGDTHGSYPISLYNTNMTILRWYL